MLKRHIDERPLDPRERQVESARDRTLRRRRGLGVGAKEVDGRGRSCVEIIRREESGRNAPEAYSFQLSSWPAATPLMIGAETTSEGPVEAASCANHRCWCAGSELSRRTRIAGFP